MSKINLSSDLREALDEGTLTRVRHLLVSLSASEIAYTLESSPPRERDILWELVDSEIESEVLQRVSEDVRNSILEKMDTAEVAAVTEGWDADDIADVLQQLPNRLTGDILDQMSQRDRQRVEAILTYDEDTAGGLMNTDTITVRPDLSIDVVLRYLRRHEELPATTDCIYVVNRDDLYIGQIPLSRLITANPDDSVYHVMDTESEVIPLDLSDVEVAQLFERNDWLSAPVVNHERHLIGRITIDDVVDVIREDADHSLMAMAGVADDDDTFLSIRKAAPRRMLWLGINLITAIMASAVIGQFQATLDKVIALAVLMPIVASMGGVAGTQTLTVVIRGMALGHIQQDNMRWLLNREFLMGVMNGLFWALIIGGVAGFWFKDPVLAGLIATAMIINLITAGIVGVLLPSIMKRIHIDPALAGGVALTTVTDIVGFISFLGLATLAYA